MSQDTIEARLELPDVRLKYRLQFDNSQRGLDGPLRLSWDDNAAKDYSHHLISFSDIEHESEDDFCSFRTSDLVINLKNDPIYAPDGTLGPGFWDGNPQSSDPISDLCPVDGILCRLSISVQYADGSWSEWAPMYTGVVDKVKGSLTGSIAVMNVLSIGTYLTSVKANVVRDGDTLYQNISITQGIERLLTQKDQNVPALADNVPILIGQSYDPSGGAAAKLVFSTVDGRAYYPSQIIDANPYPNGTLAGYAVVVTSGAAAGKAFYIISSVETGTSTVTLYVLGKPVTEGLYAGDSAILTGWCFPFLKAGPINELAGWDIATVKSVPSADSRFVLSRLGRPPEDGSNGITRALVSSVGSGSMKTFEGVDGKIFLYDHDADTHTLLATVTDTNFKFRRAFFNSADGYYYFVGWIWNPGAYLVYNTVAGYVFRVNANTAPGQVWTVANAINQLPYLHPGDRQVRKGVHTDSNYRGAGYVMNIGSNWQWCEPVLFPQDVYFIEYGQNAFYRANRYLPGETAPNAGGPSWVAATGYLGTIPMGWYYLDWYMSWNASNPTLTSVNLGGKYQLYQSGGDLPGIYWWSYISASKTYRLNRYDMTAHTSAMIKDVGAEQPIGMSISSDGAAAYWYCNIMGTDTAFTKNRPACYKLVLSTAALSTVWDPGENDAYRGFWILDGDQNFLCITYAWDPANFDSSYTYRQKFVLCNNALSPTFWNQFYVNQSNVIYVSRHPFGNFFTDPNGVVPGTWCIHHGYNTLWQLNASSAGPVSYEPTVQGDKTICSQMSFAIRYHGGTDYDWKLMAVSSDDYVDLSHGPPPGGKYVLWQYARSFSPRIEWANWGGLDRWKSLAQIAETIGFIAYFDRFGKLSLVKRPGGSSPSDYEFHRSDVFTADRYRDPSQVATIIDCSPQAGIRGNPKVTFKPINVDDNGNPITGKVFNGDISVRQAGTSTVRIVMTCTVGNAASPLYPTRPQLCWYTWWKFYCPTAFPALIGGGGGVSYQAKSDWWNIYGDVWVKLAANASTGVTPVGFYPGDQIEIVCPGLEAQATIPATVTAQDTTNYLASRQQGKTISNSLLTIGRAVDACRNLLRIVSVTPFIIEIEQRLWFFMRPLTMVRYHLDKLNLGGTGGNLIWRVLSVSHSMENKRTKLTGIVTGNTSYDPDDFSTTPVIQPLTGEPPDSNP